MFVIKLRNGHYVYGTNEAGVVTTNVLAFAKQFRTEAVANRFIAVNALHGTHVCAALN